MPLTFTAGTSVESTGSVTSTTVTLPAGLAAGDYTIIVVSLNASSGTITTPSGWTDILPQTNSVNGSTSDCHAIFYRKWVSGDTDPSVTTKSGRVAMTPVRVQGADASTFVDISATVTQTASGATTVTAPTITPTSTTLVCTFNGRDAANGNFQTPYSNLSASMTSIAEASGKATSQTNAGHLIAYEVVTANSATGTRQADPAQSVEGAMGVSFSLNAAASGTNYDKTPADAEGVTDAASVVQNLTRTPSDPAGVSDAVTTQQSLARTHADSEGLTDSVAATQGMDRSVLDTAGINDSATARQDLVRAAADPTGLTDSAEYSLDSVRSKDDPAGLSDAVTAQQDLTRTAADAAGLTDIVTAVQALMRSLADSVGITDIADAQITGLASTNYTRNPADALGVRDALTAIQAMVRDRADSLALTDSAAALQALDRALADAAGVTDAAEFTQTLNRALAEAVGLSDAAEKSLGFNRPPADTSGLSDSLTISMGMVREPADLAGLSDAVQTIMVAFRSVADQVGISDSVTAVIGSPFRDLILAGVPLATRWTIAALSTRWSYLAVSHTRLTATPLLSDYASTPLAARWASSLLPGETMPAIEILASAGAVKYVGGTVTEATGKDITAATFVISLGSEFQPGRTWLTPDSNTVGATTASRVIKLLVSSAAPAGLVIPGIYWAWVRVADSPEIEPLRVQGPITVR